MLYLYANMCNAGQITKNYIDGKYINIGTAICWLDSQVKLNDSVTTTSRYYVKN
jgi:hypothetical protein